MNADGVHTRLLRLIIMSVVGASGFVAVAAAILSLRWQYIHDAPLMVYAGYLIDCGAVPYKNFFDMNMPGTFFIMWAAGSIFGWDDAGFRLFDLLCLLSISAATFFWLRRGAGTLSAVAAPVAFALWYLKLGPSMSLQREFLALTPFTLMLAIAVSNTVQISRRRVFTVGLLVATTVLIKPQFLALSLPVLIYIVKNGVPLQKSWRQFAWFGAGAAIPAVITFVYLMATGGLKPFLEIALNYWPLYSHMTGDHAPISGIQRFVYLIRATGDGLFNAYPLMAIIGMVVFYRSGKNRRFVWLVGGLLVAAGVYPAMSGQFWGYHWIPFYYTALCAASLAARLTGESRAGTLLPVVMVLAVLMLLSIKTVSARYDDPAAFRHDVSDEVARFLGSRLRSGDTVQPLDWTGGAVHGMLKARAPLATRFMYDFHFYHHVNHSYIVKLRSDFLRELEIAHPRFIVNVFGYDKPWPWGPGTSGSFPELQRYVERHYVTVKMGATHQILECVETAHGTLLRK